MRDSLEHFSAPVRSWFSQQLGKPTLAQSLGWGPIVAGASTLVLAPTGSGKTLAAFLAALDELMFRDQPCGSAPGVRVLYISPLKALGADIEKNLRAPVSGISQHAATQRVACRIPTIAVRSGDTPMKERSRLKRAPSDILITTPESFYLMLTSSARQILTSVDTVIIDEIHALVTTKRGAHLALSLERLEGLRGGRKALQRIGLSATQTPLQEVATFLSGFCGAGPDARARPVTIVDAGSAKQLAMSVEMVRHVERVGPGELGAAGGVEGALQSRLLELILGHRSTMVFVNNRSSTEKLASALNEAAGQELCLAHHGSISKDRRLEIEERLKRGELRAIIATSSLELGIDVGAVDLVVQIESPPSITSAMQRVGRSGHSVGLVSTGVIFPKHLGDLLPCAAVVDRMKLGAVERSRYPRNPLDVLAQQIAAMCSVEQLEVERLFDWVRQAAPFAELPRAAFEGVLDMLSGKFAASDLSELSRRLVWDRKHGTLHATKGTHLIAVTSGGTIPDRGLFGVFMLGERAVRVGELDEEMVFESRIGDVFILGASSWRIEQITHERVLVSPAPAEAGRMPFWRGDAPGRPAEFGRAIGVLSRTLLAVPRAAALEQLIKRHGLSVTAAQQLMEYLQQQQAATAVVPSDQTLVVERFVDEVGDKRFCLLSPYGTPVHAPWAIAAEMNFQRLHGVPVESHWHNDGIVFRVPQSERAFETHWMFPDPDEVEDLLVSQLGQSALFAARFRENAMRALLMPRRRPGGRTPLWAQRKRAARLLRAAADQGDFPILLETYRECLQDVFDVQALKSLLQQVAQGQVQTLALDASRPSPFSRSLLFAYAGNDVYDRDVPLAERRARVLSLNHAELRQLLGEAELRQLLDVSCIRELALVLSGEKHRVIRHADGLADALLSYGDLAEEELRALTDEPLQIGAWLSELMRADRVLEVRIANQKRFIAVEDASRYSDAAGVSVPQDLPTAFLASAKEPLIDLVSRYARCHVPFTVTEVAGRLGLSTDAAELALKELFRRGRVEYGDFMPGGSTPEWCDTEVLRLLKRRSLEALRSQVQPVPASRFASLLLRWQRVVEPRAGIDGLLDTLEQLQAVPLTIADLESEVLPARIGDLAPNWLDQLISSGEIVWRGLAPIGERDGRIAFFLADQYPLLAPPARVVPTVQAERIRSQLRSRGALFFQDLVEAHQGFPPDVLKTLWHMVWAGEVSNDTFSPLRSLQRKDKERERAGRRLFRSRRSVPAGSEGRWWLLPAPVCNAGPSAESLAAWSQVLLNRQAIVTREGASNEMVPGGFSSLLPLLRALEERSQVRRGYFVAGLSGQQFAVGGAGDSLRQGPAEPLARAIILAASDPANVYGSVLAWPDGSPRPQRASGSKVVLHEGELLAFASKGFSHIATFLDQNRTDQQLALLAKALVTRQETNQPRVMLVQTVDGQTASTTLLGSELLKLGFAVAEKGWLRKVAAG